MQKVIPVFDHSSLPNVSRMPSWIRQTLSQGLSYSQTARSVHQQALNTVCEEARCPNRGECWSAGTATFMLLGDTCTRACGFCAVKTGKPDWQDTQEPRRIAAAVAQMGLDYVVLTSVNRDDLPDGGAAMYAACVKALRQQNHDIGLELLTPDFHRCQREAVETICRALDDVPRAGRRVQLVWGHNVETVPSLYRKVRKGADYRRSLNLLALAVRQTGIEAKSALMLGLGESREEVMAVLQDLRDIGVQRLALGQYLRPTRYHLPVLRYLQPAEFDEYAGQARRLGFTWVKAGPLVRSSYHAEDKQEVTPQ